MSKDRARIDALNTEAWDIGLREPMRSRELAGKALEASREIRYPLGEALALRTVGYSHLISSELEAALNKTLRRARKTASPWETRPGKRQRSIHSGSSMPASVTSKNHSATPSSVST